MVKLAAALLLSTATLLSCSGLTNLNGGPVGTVVEASIDQAMLDSAWREALRVGRGNPRWPLSVSLARVVYVPSSLQLGEYQFYGITVTEPMYIDGKLVLVETIEIHLPHNLACHIREVLVHELLHTVAFRRALTDKRFQDELAAAGGGEAWVRSVYPTERIDPCPE